MERLNETSSESSSKTATAERTENKPKSRLVSFTKLRNLSILKSLHDLQDNFRAENQKPNSSAISLSPATAARLKRLMVNIKPIVTGKMSSTERQLYAKNSIENSKPKDEPSTSQHHQTTRADSDDEITQNLTCSICFEIFIQPVSTQCEHYFCDKCIKQFFNVNTIGENATAPCPNCKQLIARDQIKPAPRILRNLLDYHHQRVISPKPTESSPEKSISQLPSKRNEEISRRSVDENFQRQLSATLLAPPAPLRQLISSNEIILPSVAILQARAGGIERPPLPPPINRPMARSAIQPDTNEPIIASTINRPSRRRASAPATGQTEPSPFIRRLVIPRPAVTELTTVPNIRPSPRHSIEHGATTWPISLPVAGTAASSVFSQQPTAINSSSTSLAEHLKLDEINNRAIQKLLIELNKNRSTIFDTIIQNKSADDRLDNEELAIYEHLERIKIELTTLIISHRFGSDQNQASNL